MDNDFKLFYINSIQNFKGLKRIYAHLIFYIAPTVHRLKPSSIVQLKEDELISLWDMYDKIILRTFRLKAIPLLTSNSVRLIMFYHPPLLEKHIKEDGHIGWLSQFGYHKNMSVDDCLVHLKSRFNGTVCPHEVGIFLGYPLDDVKSYIKSPHSPGLATGYWKVYNNLSIATVTFEQYDTIRYSMMKKILDGNI